MDELLDIASVARYLGVSERTVYSRVRSGDLPALKVGRLWRVRVHDLEAWLAEGPQGRAATEGSSGIRLLERHRQAIDAACKRHSVKRLDIFGSVLREDFTATSDIDFLVEFEPVEAAGFDHPYWALADELEAILGRRVDLLMVSAVTNPYLADELQQTRVVVYAA
jgi:hypothetical protein